MEKKSRTVTSLSCDQWASMYSVDPIDSTDLMEPPGNEYPPLFVLNIDRLVKRITDRVQKQLKQGEQR